MEDVEIHRRVEQCIHWHPAIDALGEILGYHRTGAWSHQDVADGVRMVAGVLIELADAIAPERAKKVRDGQ